MGSVWLENRTKSRSRENNWYLLWRHGGRDSKKFHRRLGNVASHVATEEKHKKVTELARGRLAIKLRESTSSRSRNSSTSSGYPIGTSSRRPRP
jgi:hypothetical protein